MEKINPQNGLGTLLTHATEGGDPRFAHVTPIYQTSVFDFPDVETVAGIFKGEIPGLNYTRWNNPNQQQLADKIAVLEGLDLLRALGAPARGELAVWCEQGLAVQARLDALAALPEELRVPLVLAVLREHFLELVVRCQIAALHEKARPEVQTRRDGVGDRHQRERAQQKHCEASLRNGLRNQIVKRGAVVERKLPIHRPHGLLHFVKKVLA